MALAEAAGAPFGVDTLEGLRAEMDRLLLAREPTVELPSAEPPPPRPTGLTLFTYPLLVDEGRQSDGAERLKDALEDPAFVEMHLADAERSGVVDGARVRISTEAGTAEAPVRVSEDLAEGAVFVPLNQPGLAANELLSGAFTADVTIEPVAADTKSESEPAVAGAEAS
jgi:anaerobic selenocysteine-containing dehydrogenase